MKYSKPKKAKNQHESHFRADKVKKSKASLSETPFRVEGQSACVEQIVQNPAQIKRIIARSEEDRRRLYDALASRAPSSMRPTVVIDSESSQAISCEVELKTIDIDEFLAAGAREEEHELILALDHLQDPRNLGAIVRSAAFFGVKTVLVPADRQVLLTQASVATAQAGFAVTQLVVCTNLSRALDVLKENHGFWVVGLDASGRAIGQEKLDFQKTVLVLGAEGAGVSQNIRKRIDVMVAIPGGENGFDSLNVSVAAGIGLYTLTQNNKSSSL